MNILEVEMYMRAFGLLFAFFFFFRSFLLFRRVVFPLRRIEGRQDLGESAVCWNVAEEGVCCSFGWIRGPDFEQVPKLNLRPEWLSCGLAIPFCKDKKPKLVTELVNAKQNKEAATHLHPSALWGSTIRHTRALVPSPNCC